MRKKIFSITLILLLMSSFVYQSVSYAFWGAAFRIVVGEAAAEGLNAVAYRAGLEAGTQDAKTKMRQRWNTDLYESMRKGELQGGAFEHRISKERAEDIMRQLNQKPTPIDGKPGWGKIALSSLAFLTATDLLYNGYEAYKEGKEVALMRDSFDVTEESPVMAVGNFSFLDMDVSGAPSRRFVYWGALNNDGTYPAIIGTVAGGVKAQHSIISYVESHIQDGISVSIRVRGVTPSGYVYYDNFSYLLTDTYLRWGNTKYPLLEPMPSSSPAFESAPIPGVKGVPFMVPTPVTQPLPAQYPLEVDFPKVIEVAVPLPGHNPTPEEWKEMNPAIRPGEIPKPLPEPNPEPKPEPGPDPVPLPKPVPVPVPEPVPVPDPKLPGDGGEPGDTGQINWPKLKLPAVALTYAFPFSLPWDVSRAFNAVFGGMSDVKELPGFKARVPTFWNDGHFEFEIKPPQIINDFLPFVRGAVLILFDIGIIYALHRWFGGAS